MNSKTVNLDIFRKDIIKFLIDMLEQYEFELIVRDVDNELCFKLIDTLVVNLGDVESCNFENLKDVINSLEIYHNDFIYADIEDLGTFTDYVYLLRAFVESDTINDYLETITPKAVDGISLEYVSGYSYSKDFIKFLIADYKAKKER